MMVCGLGFLRLLDDDGLHTNNNPVISNLKEEFHSTCGSKVGNGVKNVLVTMIPVFLYVNIFSAIRYEGWGKLCLLRTQHTRLTGIIHCIYFQRIHIILD